MSKLVNRFWREECGAIISTELVAVMTISGLALTAGLAKVSCALNAEFEDLAPALRGLDQSFRVGGHRSSCAVVSGSSFSEREQVQFGCPTLVCDVSTECIELEPPCLPAHAPHHDASGDGVHHSGY